MYVIGIPIRKADFLNGRTVGLFRAGVFSGADTVQNTATIHRALIWVTTPHYKSKTGEDKKW